VATQVPDHTAVRVALWRAMHVELDAPPHVFEDEVGLALAAPDAGWRRRPDMNAQATSGFRASIVARARFVEDLVIEAAARGVRQYVLLGAGLDTFAQRRADLAARLRVFEVDQPDTQRWKQERLVALGYGLPEWLRFVPVDFERGASWWAQLLAAGFDANAPALVASTGVSLYLTEEAIAATLRTVARLAPGSTLAMTYMLPLELVAPDERVSREFAERGARASGTPFISFFSPAQATALALACGFKTARHVSAADHIARYFADRADGLRPAMSEEILVATT
jgi:methyltransferase (TIGR00027 family)